MHPGVLPLLLLSAPQAPAAGPDPAEVSPAALRATLRQLCEEPRVAGTLESLAAAEFAADSFQAAGLEVRRAEYLCFLPRQTGQALEMLAADGSWTALDLREEGYPADPWSQRDQQPPMHGLTAPGTASGRLVYAGYGTEAEFARLRELHGAALDGCIALCRYGMVYRGQKVANAEAAGCAGALLYTDVQDDGATRGAILPEGPWRPPSGIQRGSVYNGDGDALTPGWPALADAHRLLPAQASGRVGIPSLPVSSANAARLLAGTAMELGALAGEVRLTVEQDPNLVPVVDVIGVLPGSTRPQEVVLIGAHRDSWGFGATDNGTGSTVLLETARVVGLAAAAGWQPARTLVFCSWDAEEWGLVGSTEWVEQHRDGLREGAVAYLNLDVVATGPSFSASCTPGLVATLEAACAAEQVPVPGGVGTPGGGSDHVPFLELGGVEVLNFGFHGGSGVYHSALDTPYLVETFLDPDFAHHASAARMAVQLLALLGDAQVAVDGSEAWLRQIARAAETLPAADEAQRGARAQLLAAAYKATLAVVDGARAERPWRFHRAFLADQGRSFLWATAGYGSRWFPDLRDAWDDEAARTAELQRLLEAISGALGG